MLNCNLLNKISMGLLISSFCNSAVAVTNHMDLNVDETFYVPKRFINTGGLFVTTNGSIVGDLHDAKFLIVGKDPNGNTKPTNFITGGVIGGTPIIKVHSGSTFNAIHNIASVSKEFFVDSDSFATFNKYVIGSGDFINNGVVTIEVGGIIGPDFNFFNNGNLNVIGNFIVPSNVKKIGKIHVVGAAGTISGNLHDAQLQIGIDSFGTKDPNIFMAVCDVNNLSSLDISAGSSFNVPADTSVAIKYAVHGDGVLNNNGTLSLVADAVIDPTIVVTNTANLNVKTQFSTLDRFVNTGSIFLTEAGDLLGNVIGGKSLNIGRNADGNASAVTYKTSGSIENVKEINVYNGEFIADKKVANYHQVNNFAVMHIKNSFEGNTIVNNSGAKLHLQSNNIKSNIKNHAGAYIVVDNFSEINGNIDNQGMFLISMPLITGELINSGDISITAPLTTTIFTNTGHVYASNKIVATALHNKAYFESKNHLSVDALINTGSIISSAINASADITNNGYLEVNDALEAVNVINSNHMHLNGDMLATTFNNFGSLVTKGDRKLGSAAFSSTGQQNFRIHNSKVFDSLTTSGVIDISNGTVNIASRFIGESQVNYKWNILTGSALQANYATTIVIPASTLHRTWSSNIVNGNLQVSYSREPFTKFTTQGLELDIAQALEKIAISSKTEDHINLVHAVASCANSHDYAANIIKLKPNANGNANYISMHNATFKKVETRISAIKENASALRGIAVGDLTSSMASWGAAFGSVANQQAIDGNLGYRATAFGAIFGVDQQVPNDDIYGAAVALSNSNINEAASTDSKTHITGYHFLVYGTNFFYGDNFFEWLFTGIINQNKSEREVILGGNNLNVASSYHNYQGGVRINLGKNMDFCSWGLAQVNTLQYSFLHQPSYNENGSPAALHIADFNSNIVTLGSGLRVFIRPDFHSALVAKPALHAMLTYDAVSSSKGINANFLIGDSDFTISQNPARIAVKMGADIGFEVKDNWQLQFSYDLEIRSRYTDNSAEIKLKYLF